MRLAIENTLGIVSAEIDIVAGQIVEVVGPNASGKTSLAVCAHRRCWRGKATRWGCQWRDAKRCYPHDGADDAMGGIVRAQTLRYDDILGTTVAWPASRYHWKQPTAYDASYPAPKPWG